MDVGAQLRSSREGKRLSLESLARTIRVQPRVLVAIERNDTAAIPPRPFGRGFVRAYAREVGLNPDETVREYFGQFAPPDVPSSDPEHTTPNLTSPRAISSRVAVSAALAIVILVAGAGLLMRVVRHPATDPGVVGTSGTTAPAAASGDSVTSKPDVVSAPAPAATPSRPIAIAIAASAPCWVEARTDGKRAMYQLLQPGEKTTLLADREVTLLAGNAGGLTWTINGRTAASFGAPGVVRTVTVTPANVGTIK
jgi:cytoskeletal protein RodZ